MWKGDAPPPERNRTEWNKQVARMRMFDALIGQRNRNMMNVLRDKAWNLILLDHTCAFGPVTDTSPPLSQIDRDFWDRVLALTRRNLMRGCAPGSTKHQITSMLERRDRMKTEIDTLIAEKGAAAVVLR